MSYASTCGETNRVTQIIVPVAFLLFFIATSGFLYIFIVKVIIRSMVFYLIRQIRSVNLKETCTSVVDQVLMYQQTDKIGHFGEFEYARQNEDVVFTFEDNSDLNDVLIALGMEDAFDAYKADFSKMSDGLYIGFVKQKTFIDVNESGTEAAAVTIVGMEKNSIGGGTPKVINFIADRPFLFIIQENSTGAVLFIGQKVS